MTDTEDMFEALVRLEDAMIERISKLENSLSDAHTYINQLESKQASLENDVYSLQTTVNRLEGI